MDTNSPYFVVALDAQNMVVLNQWKTESEAAKSADQYLEYNPKTRTNPRRFIVYCDGNPVYEAGKEQTE